MPTKRKFTARFPTAKIKRIMQVDEDVGKISATVPSVVSCALETCISQLVTKAYELALSRNSRTVTPSHLKQVIEELSEFEFAKDLVRDVAVLKPVKPGTGVPGDSLDNGDCCSASDLPSGASVGGSLDNHNHAAMSSHSSSCGAGELGTSRKRGRPKKPACQSPSPLATVSTEKKRRRAGTATSISRNRADGGDDDKAAQPQPEQLPIDLCTAPAMRSPSELQIALDTDSSSE